MVYHCSIDPKLPIKVFDVGARYGLHPTWKNCKSPLQYLLIEADPVESERLSERYQSIECVRVANFAVSTQAGTVDLNVLANPAMSTSFKRTEPTPLFRDDTSLSSQVEIEQTISVPSITLNGLSNLYFHPDFLKLDIEGQELDALRSLTDYSNIIGLRCEINFASNFASIPSTFPGIHGFLEERGFLLINLDYAGQGDPWSPIVSDSHRYGSLNTTDGVWLQNPHALLERGCLLTIYKACVFLFLNNAPDIALWLLKNITLDKPLPIDTSISRFVSTLLVKHLYSLKWTPSQDLKTHKLFYESLFAAPYPSLNLFNESVEYNPIETFAPFSPHQP